MTIQDFVTDAIIEKLELAYKKRKEKKTPIVASIQTTSLLFAISVRNHQ